VMLLALLGVGGERTDVGGHVAGLFAGGIAGASLHFAEARVPLGRLAQLTYAAAALVLFAGSWLLALLATDVWLTFSLELFPYTRPWGEHMRGWLLRKLGAMVDAVLQALPGLFTVAINFVITRFLSQVITGFFRRVQSQHIRIGWLDEDTARPTQRIIIFVLWLFAIAMAYPYLPGSNTEAFKGLSVLVGLMISIGGASVVGQALAGLILMYTHTFRIGDYVSVGDNEGTWVPACPLHWVKPGSFNGVVDGGHRALKSTSSKPDPSEHPKPLCWMPKNVDNSGGGQVWVTSDAWGPFKGELLHLSYGTSSLFKVLKEEVNGQMQGGVVRFPVKFTSSAMRARFNSKDGQLYLSGLRGWQSNAAKEGGFDRVRYTGAPVCMPTGLNATTKADRCILSRRSRISPRGKSSRGVWSISSITIS